MKHRILLAMLGITGMLSLNQAFAADKPAASLAVQGKVLFEDSFARPEMTPKWRVGKGFFTVKDGVVTIAENPDDKHGAYAYVTPAFPYKDIVAEFSVKLEGARSCSLMINDSKYKESHAGHILKATIAPGKVNVADWKFGAMKNDIYEKMKDTEHDGGREEEAAREHQGQVGRFQSRRRPVAVARRAGGDRRRRDARQRRRQARRVPEVRGRSTTRRRTPSGSRSAGNRC